MECWITCSRCLSHPRHLILNQSFDKKVIDCIMTWHKLSSTYIFKNNYSLLKNLRQMFSFNFFFSNSKCPCGIIILSPPSNSIWILCEQLMNCRHWMLLEWWGIKICFYCIVNICIYNYILIISLIYNHRDVIILHDVNITETLTRTLGDKPLHNVF